MEEIDKSKLNESAEELPEEIEESSRRKKDSAESFYFKDYKRGFEIELCTNVLSQLELVNISHAFLVSLGLIEKPKETTYIQ